MQEQVALRVTFRELLVANASSDTNRHYGSRIAFDRDGFLYFSVGDRGVRPNGQRLDVHAGKILRLHEDGRVPSDNPFVGKKGVLPEIWSYGHRNPQGMVFDFESNVLWSMEHGPRGGDELNLIKKGANYGWAIVSHGKEYWGPFQVGEAKSKPGMVDPVKVYIPSIAPSGLVQYQGEAFPEWQGDLFSGAMALQHLNQVKIQNNEAVDETRYLRTMNKRIRNVIESPEGWLYVSTDDGEIYRIQPAAN